MSSHLQCRRWQKRILEKGSKKDDRFGSGCAQDFIKSNGSGRSDHGKRDDIGSSQEERGSAGGGILSSHIQWQRCQKKIQLFLRKI